MMLVFGHHIYFATQSQDYYVRQKKEEVMFSLVSVCLSVCLLSENLVHNL